MGRRTFERVVFLADTHIGSSYGSMPPSMQGKSGNEQLNEYQRLLWEFYTRVIDDLRPIDKLVMVGDAIDGDGYKDSGLSVVTSNRILQVDGAEEFLRYTKVPPERIYIVQGTDSHVASGGPGVTKESWEWILAKQMGVPLDPTGLEGNVFIHRNIRFNGLVFDIRHFTGSSSVPW